jgi:hypothetical protein
VDKEISIQCLHLVEELSSLHQLEDQKVVLVALAKADQLDDIRVVRSSHNLYLFENVGALNYGVRKVSAVVNAIYQAQSLKRDEEKSLQTPRSRVKERFAWNSDTNLRNSGPLLEVGVQVLIAGLCVRTEGGEHGGRRKELGKEQETISHLISVLSAFSVSSPSRIEAKSIRRLASCRASGRGHGARTNTKRKRIFSRPMSPRQVYSCLEIPPEGRIRTMKKYEKDLDSLEWR